MGVVIKGGITRRNVSFAFQLDLKNYGITLSTFCFCSSANVRCILLISHKMHVKLSIVQCLMAHFLTLVTYPLKISWIETREGGLGLKFFQIKTTQNIEDKVFRFSQIGTRGRTFSLSQAFTIGTTQNIWSWFKV
jgi:hypothetical protein